MHDIEPGIRVSSRSLFKLRQGTTVAGVDDAQINHVGGSQCRAPLVVQTRPSVSDGRELGTTRCK